MAPRHRERQALSGTQGRIDLREVAQKLELHIGDADGKYPHRKYAEEMLQKHYNSVFSDRRASPYKVYLFIHHDNEKETYIIRVAQNNLGSIMKKMPKPGKYRYFFKNNLENNWEEIEDEEATVHTQLKDGTNQIFCHVFLDS